ncbi:hypothetical protein [Methylopila sp. M107]|uniref:hypothetical protein n=1 Tax=Methylopila sp. M107 TaxID=1101190 RepID=UPI00036E1F73|nr:hypothetical protein [Methylopila sp. M107]
MKIRRIRIVLPSRLAPEALATARATGAEIARALANGATPQGGCAVTLADRGEPGPMFARSAGAAVASAIPRGRG